MSSRNSYDVCVIGSGAAGGVMAKELAEGGANILLLEAGPRIEMRELRSHAWPYELRYRGLRGERQASLYPPELTKAISYNTREDIAVDRIRVVGGRTVHWNAVCLRFAARDFRERSLEGTEEDWPITYPELAPYYDRVEQMIGVTGSREGLEIVPDGHYLKPLRLRCSERILKRACEKMGYHLIPARKATLTEPYDGRPACHYCGHCMDGCDVDAIFNTATAMIPKAERTGRFTLRANTLARKLLVNAAGQVRAVSVIDRETLKEEAIEARIFVVSCATIESARLLLNSSSEKFPNGLANSSDRVGRYLHGHLHCSFLSYLDGLVGTRPSNQDGATDHSLIPRSIAHPKKRNYAGGFQYQMQYSGFMFPHHARHLSGFGKGLKREVRILQPGFLNMGGWGKVLARPENRVTVDPNRRDAYGIPIPVIHFRFCENDRNLWKDMATRAEEILHQAGARQLFQIHSQPMGFTSHEVGTARMGHDPTKSVLNSYCQAHDVRNLFVVDGSCFVTFPEKNPTLTIMALALRTAEYIRRQRSQGELQ